MILFSCALFESCKTNDEQMCRPQKTEIQWSTRHSSRNCLGTYWSDHPGVFIVENPASLSAPRCSAWSRFCSECIHQLNRPPECTVFVDAFHDNFLFLFVPRFSIRYRGKADNRYLDCVWDHYSQVVYQHPRCEQMAVLNAFGIFLRSSACTSAKAHEFEDESKNANKRR